MLQLNKDYHQIAEIGHVSVRLFFSLVSQGAGMACTVLNPMLNAVTRVAAPLSCPCTGPERERQLTFLLPESSCFGTPDVAC